MNATVMNFVDHGQSLTRPTRPTVESGDPALALPIGLDGQLAGATTSSSTDLSKKRISPVASKNTGTTDVLGSLDVS